MVEMCENLHKSHNLLSFQVFWYKLWKWQLETTTEV